MPISHPFCLSCKHFPKRQIRGSKSYFCSAFPNGDGIPLLIFLGDEKHNEIIEGQEGEYIFDPDEYYLKIFGKPK